MLLKLRVSQDIPLSIPRGISLILMPLFPENIQKKEEVCYHSLEVPMKEFDPLKSFASYFYPPSLRESLRLSFARFGVF